MKTPKLEIEYPRQRQLLNDLSQNLNCAVKAYRKLLQLSRDIQESLLSDTVEQILLLASQQAKLARKLQAHEEDRIVLIEKLFTSFTDGFALRFASLTDAFGSRGDSFALPSEILSLSQLISLVPEPYATNYITLRKKLHSLISKLNALCFQNARLISSKIEYFDGMLEILANLNENSESTYLCTGKIDNSQYKPRMLDYNL